jgi:hypothetical protein
MEKKFLPLFIKKHEFANGGTMLKCGCKTKDLIQFLTDNEDGDFFNFDIKAKRESSPDDKTSHYAEVNTWKPNSDYKSTTKNDGSTKPDDLPF